MLGTSGRLGNRLADITASGHSLPALMCGMAVKGSMVIATSPLSTAASCGAVPLYGTARMSAPLAALKVSTNSCSPLVP